MNLNEFRPSKKTEMHSKVIESHFGDSIDFDDLTKAQATKLLSRTQKIIAEAKKSSGFYSSETNPDYLKAVMLESALKDKVLEFDTNTQPSANPLSSSPTPVLDPKKPLAANQKPKMQDIDSMARNVKGPAATTARKIAQQAKSKSGDKNAQIQAAIALNAMSGADANGMAESSNTGKNNTMDKEYSIKYVQEDDEWVVVDAVGNHVESFIEKHEAARKARELNKGGKAPAAKRHVNYRGDMGESKNQVKKPVREGKVKDMAIDLEEMSPAKFKEKYKMTKAEARKTSATKKKTVKESSDSLVYAIHGILKKIIDDELMLTQDDMIYDEHDIDTETVLPIDTIRGVLVDYNGNSRRAVQAMADTVKKNCRIRCGVDQMQAQEIARKFEYSVLSKMGKYTNVVESKKRGVIKENKLAKVPSGRLVKFIKEHRTTKHPLLKLVETELRTRLARKQKLSESEVQQAQVVLAAQEMVDSVQKMVEQASSVQFKDLPALVSQIRIDQGPDQSMQFNKAATAAFSGMLQALQGAKDQLEGALGIVTGQGMPEPSVDQMAAGDNPDSLGDFNDTPDVTDVDLEKETDDITGLGRERR